ncbi:ABC transporter substrate-binding protein [Halalkalibacter alkalisediminis]|uniref:ABC transporter substrate-binding protein n=1 Tax=Halalkalibacter alkalisediminis TaxID=935616 RepID=A0ABV6N9X6_9BACI|nr:ABC transporter substrate-binding protein [Halalkalibacter alkalisediminis]
MLLLLMLVLALTTFLAACGGNDDASAPTDQEDGDKDLVVQTEPSGDQVLIFARGGDSVSLDYASVTDGESSRVTKQIYETLIEFDQDSFDIGPGLATDWSFSDDGLTFTFQLREGVKFHDGTDFNAEAVKLNFERWADNEHPFNFANEGYTYSVYGTQFGGFKGDEGHAIKVINVLGDHEIEFVLNHPLGAFMQNMGMSYFAITSPAAFEEHGSRINENPVGTGPFKFVSWQKDDSIILEKNENYWKEGYPKLDRVIFQVIPDNSARLTALRSGQIDIMDGLNPDDIATVEGDPELQIFERATNNVGYLGFNTEKAPFDNQLVRQAINHAIDKESLIFALYNGMAQAAKNAVPPGYLGYNDDIEAYDFNPEKAKSLLAEAGYPDGFEFDLWTMPVARPYMPDPERAAEALQADLAQVGLKASIVTMEWATYLEKTEQGEQDIFMLGWSGVNGDPDYFLSNLLSSHAIPGGNRTFYRNEEVTSLLDQAKTIVDPVEREALYKQTQALIHEDAPMVTLVHSVPVLAGASNVNNYVPHPSTSEVLTYVELAN